MEFQDVYLVLFRNLVRHSTHIHSLLELVIPSTLILLPLKRSGSNYKGIDGCFHELLGPAPGRGLFSRSHKIRS